jgi:dihydroneopterin aldolase
MLPMEKAPSREPAGAASASPCTNRAEPGQAVWDHRASHQCLALRGVRVAVRIGAYAEEHAAPQLISVDAELYRRHGRFTGRSLGDCLDYDRIFRYLTEEWPQRQHTELLEQLAEDLVQFCLVDPRVEACRVTIRKLEIYAGRGVPEIAVYRCRSDRVPNAAF